MEVCDHLDMVRRLLVLRDWLVTKGYLERDEYEEAALARALGDEESNR